MSSFPIHQIIFTSPDYSLPLFVESIGYGWDQEKVVRPLGYPFYQWMQSDFGSGHIQVGKRTLVLHPGEGCLIAANTPHAYWALDDKWITSYFTFGGVFVKELTAAMGFHEFTYVDHPSKAMLDFTANSYYSVKGQIDHTGLNASSFVYALLLALKPFLNATTVQSPTAQQIVNAVLPLIHNHYNENLTNQDFAAVAHYSVQYVNRTFHEVYKQTPKQYLNAHRIKKVKELLINSPKMTLAEVAATVGFNTENYLIRMFKEEEHITPGQFRAMFS